MIQMIRGFFMALADSVPGVSGGTIAFVLGFYDEFISSLHSLMSRDSWKKKKQAIIFFIKLGIGWIVGFVLSVFILTQLFESKIYMVSSLFIGFILFSIPIILKEEKQSLTRQPIASIWAIVGIVIVVGITYLNPVTSGIHTDISIFNLSFGLGLYVFVAGMVAISAMVLPGISGSALLLIFGLYTAIISAVKETLTLNLSFLPVLIIFGCGIIFGVATTIKGIRYLLMKHRPTMMYLILGLMLGSIYAIFQGPLTLENPQPAMTWDTFEILPFLVGCALIFLLEKLKNILTES